MSRSKRRPQVEKIRDHLRAAARCWERAGFFPEAAERFSQIEAWHDAGRCFSQAERHADAALAYYRADEPLLEAREQLMGNPRASASRLYERLRSELFVSRPAEVEVLLGLGEVESATRSAITSGDREAVANLTRLTTTRGRPDLAVTRRQNREEGFLDKFAPWNRCLRWQPPLPTAKAARNWPSVEFAKVSLVSIWEQKVTTGDYFLGSRAIAWSADSTMFAAALDTGGLACARVSPEGVRFQHWQMPANPLSASFLPGKHEILVGFRDGDVSSVEADGSVLPQQILRMPSDVWSLTFAPDGDQLAVGASAQPGGAMVKVFGWQNSQAISLLEEFNEAGQICRPLTAWSPDGRIYWTPGFYKNASRLFVQRQDIGEPNGAMIHSLDFTSDGRFLFSSSYDGIVAIRDGITGQSLATPEHFNNSVYGAVVHPRAALIAIGEGYRLHLSRLHPDQIFLRSQQSELTLRGPVISLSFSPNGRHLLVITYGHLHLFSVDLKP